MLNTFDLVVIVTGVMASLLTLVLLFRHNEPITLRVGGLVDVLRLLFLTVICSVVVLGMIAGAWFGYRYLTSPRPPPVGSVPSVSLENDDLVGLAPQNPCSIGGGSYTLDIDNHAGTDAWDYAISITDKDPRGLVWATVPSGGTGHVAAQGSLVVEIAPVASLCQDIEPHDSMQFTLKVTLVRAGGATTAKADLHATTISVTVRPYYPK